MYSLFLVGDNLRVDAGAHEMHGYILTQLSILWSHWSCLQFKSFNKINDTFSTLYLGWNTGRHYLTHVRKLLIQYCAKVMQTKFNEFRSLFSQTFERNFVQFQMKSFTLKRYFKRHFVEILHNISEGQMKNHYCKNSQKRKFAWQQLQWMRTWEIAR